MDIPILQYQQCLIDNYKAIRIERETYFKTKKQAKLAAEWVLSYDVINKLKGE